MYVQLNEQVGVNDHVNNNGLFVEILSDHTLYNIEKISSILSRNNDIYPSFFVEKYDVIETRILNDDTQPLFIWMHYHSTRYQNIDSFCKRINSIIQMLEHRKSHVLIAKLISNPFDKETIKSKIQKLNYTIKKLSDTNDNINFVDTEKVLNFYGYEKTYDFRYGWMFKKHFKDQFIASLLEESFHNFNTNKKCIVLDCDNTLWGGIVGEDGPYGVKCSNEAYPGNVFYNIQALMKNYLDNGIILALNSKNNLSDVEEAFKVNNFPLKTKDFSVMSVNWENKVDNLKEIANKLNIGLDAIIFIDDSDYECQQVQLALPQVYSILVPKKLWLYNNEISDKLSKCFTSKSASTEDKNRARLMGAKLAADAEKEHITHKDFLRILNVEASMENVTRHNLSRLSQLTEKTNQFNLFKKIYSEKDISEFIKNKKNNIFALKVTDKFGDLGITNLAMVKMIDKDIFIDAFLMSCRIFERNVEYKFLQMIIKKLNLNKKSCIKIKYKSTLKNKPAKTFLNSIKINKNDITTLKNPEYYIIDFKKIMNKDTSYIVEKI